VNKRNFYYPLDLLLEVKQKEKRETELALVAARDNLQTARRKARETDRRVREMEERIEREKKKVFGLVMAGEAEALERSVIGLTGDLEDLLERKRLAGEELQAVSDDVAEAESKLGQAVKELKAVEAHHERWILETSKNESRKQEAEIEDAWMGRSRDAD